MHVYTYLDSAPQGRALRRLTDSCRLLGMSRTQATSFVRPGGPWPRRLYDSPAPGHIYQAIEYASLRLAAFLVCLAPQDDSRTWRELDRDWREAVGVDPDTGHAGRVKLYYALYDDDREVERLADAVVAALPEGLGPLGSAAAELFTGCYLWEVGADDQHRPDRVAVLLAPADRETDSDAWVWPNRHAAMPPLPAYFWQLANVRHQARRFVERRTRYRPDALLDQARRFERAETTRRRRTAAQEASLSALRRQVALLSAHEAVLRTMHRTVEAAADNAGVWLAEGGRVSVRLGDRDPAWGRDPGDPISEDLQYTQWLLAEIADEADTVRDAVAYGEPMARIGSAEIEQRLREQGERAEFLTVVQTSVIAAVGLLLAASQTLDYPWPTYASLKVPFLVCIACAALFVPLVSTMRARSDSRWSWIWAGVTGVAFAASSAWFAATAFARWGTGEPAPVGASLIAASAVAAVAGIAVARWAVRSRSVPL
ncbi:CATRA conflict system CASPASE/TPR repeat-associated protein [Micromonospora sp. NPDC002389]|uniref:CATRA conflict system CASPASE/TPR repeat-associated protein n=1 Tax=Micromonospora sp. NPDC002389 TaxID=3154272 RepID=UPI003327394C